MQGIKYDGDKPKFSLLKPDALLEMVKVLTYGAKKYSPDNWKLLENSQQRYFDAANRHMWAWFGGEKKDRESGYHHLAHAMSSLLFIMQMDIEEEQRKQQKRDELLDAVLGQPELHGR
jgi:hypothetical protein